MSPLGKLKDLVIGTTKLPFTVGGAVVGHAKGVVDKAAAGLHGTRGATPDGSPAARQDEADTGLTITPDQPVNVTEALDLDPAPVAKPKPRKKQPSRPTTSIDAAADPDHVDATPADVARAVSGEDHDRS